MAGVVVVAMAAHAGQATRAAGGERIRVELQVGPAGSGAARGRKAVPRADVIRTQRLLQDRVVRYGLPDPRVRFQPPDRIVMEIAVGQSGLQTRQDLKALLSETGRLEFRAVPTVYAEGHERRPRVDSGPDGPIYTFTDLAGREVPTERVLAKSALLASGKDFAPTSRVITVPGQMPQVSFALREPARTRFKQFTGTHVNTYVAIALDGRLLACRLIRTAIPGEGVLEGGFDKPDGMARATRLSIMISSGPLPLPVRWVNARPE